MDCLKIFVQTKSAKSRIINILADVIMLRDWIIKAKQLRAIRKCVSESAGNIIFYHFEFEVFIFGIKCPILSLRGLLLIVLTTFPIILQLISNIQWIFSRYKNYWAAVPFIIPTYLITRRAINYIKFKS